MIIKDVLQYLEATGWHYFCIAYGYNNDYAVICGCTLLYMVMNMYSYTGLHMVTQDYMHSYAWVKKGIHSYI